MSDSDWNDLAEEDPEAFARFISTKLSDREYEFLIMREFESGQKSGAAMQKAAIVNFLLKEAGSMWVADQVSAAKTYKELASIINLMPEVY